MYHVVASDLDGTLLSPDHILTPYTKETLKLLTQRDVHFVFATGRHHIDVAQIRDNLEISAFMITSNGARVHNTAGELIFSHNLDADIARDLYNIEHHNPDILTNVYLNDEWYMNRESPAQEEFFRESVFKYQVFEPALLPTDGVCKVYFTCDDHDNLL
ncbi:HAD-IIB family hydrolase, partial [Yersinia enterocolitica]